MGRKNSQRKTKAATAVCRIKKKLSLFQFSTKFCSSNKWFVLLSKGPDSNTYIKLMDNKVLQMGAPKIYLLKTFLVVYMHVDQK